MHSQANLTGRGVGVITKRVAYRYVVDRIRALCPRDQEEVTIKQDRRYIDADAISVDGRWYAVQTCPYVDGIEVTANRPIQERGKWDMPMYQLDENGRWRTDATNEIR